MADPRELVEASFAAVWIECSACGEQVEIDDVEFVVKYPGAHPYGHHFDLPKGWTINAPENGALCGVGLTCAACNGAPGKRKKARR